MYEETSKKLRKLRPDPDPPEPPKEVTRSDLKGRDPNEVFNEHSVKLSKYFEENDQWYKNGSEEWRDTYEANDKYYISSGRIVMEAEVSSSTMRISLRE